MNFGIHASISGGIDQAVVRAADIDCNTLQVFCSNPRGWKIRDITEAEINKIKKNLTERQLRPLVVHSSYLINLASPKDDLYRKSIAALKQELERTDLIGGSYYVVHPGSHTGSGKESGIKRISQALEEIITSVQPEATILLENVAGAGTSIGQTLEELERIFDLVSDVSQLGICFDTCHGFAAGYDLREKKEVKELVNKLEAKFGLHKLGVIHANDCKGKLGANKDRHAHIGQGEIGNKGFKNLLHQPQLKDKPFILETPVDEAGDDKRNLTNLRELAVDR